MQSYDGRVVLVAGAAHGLGRDTALGLLDRGAEVIALDCDERGLIALSASSRNDRLHCAALASNDSTTVETVIARIMGNWQPDALVNALGLRDLGPGQPLPEHPVKEQYILLRSVARRMADRRRGALLTLADTRVAHQGLGGERNANGATPLALMMSCFELTLAPLGIACALLPLEPGATDGADRACRALAGLLQRPTR